MAELKMAKMAAIIKLGEKEWVWVRLKVSQSWVFLRIMSEAGIRLNESVFEVKVWEKITEVSEWVLVRLN